MKTGRDEDRLSILEKIGRGELSIEDAETELAHILEESEPVAKVEEKKEVVEKKLEVEQEEEVKLEQVWARDQKREETHIPTRRERKLAQAERYQDWNPQMMVGTTDSWQLPWSDRDWQWTWQNFGYPVYINHSVSVTEESKLQVVLYEGDLFISGWDESTLKMQGAALDVRTGQDENAIRVASSSGQLQLWLPGSVTHVEARVILGDAWLRNISADTDTYCQSGDLGCERIRGSVKAQVNGGDARLVGIEGSIDAEVMGGSSDVRDISSASVSLKSTGGNIWLSLDSVSAGKFRCENSGGDINLITKGELSCDMLLEATEGGQISPLMLPWQRLLERSASRLHGILAGGGASIHLSTRGGRIYVQESWIGTFPVPTPS